jgi:predicted Zn-dependent protease
MLKISGLRITLSILALQAFCFAALTADQVVVSKAEALVKAGKLDQAEVLLRSASSADQNSAVLHAALGQLLLKEHKYEDAVLELGQAAQQKPNSREYNLLSAEALIGWKHYPTAIQFLKAVEPRFGKDAHFHYELGLAYYYESDLNATRKELEQAVRISPNFERAEFLLANCLVVGGETARALTIFRKLVKEHPDNAFYWATLGMKAGHVDAGGSAEESLRAVRRALAIAPNDSYVQFSAATVFTQTGEYKSARPLLEHLEEIAPKGLEAHALLVRVYARLGERELAQKETQVVEQLQKEIAAEHSSDKQGDAHGEAIQQP